MSKALLKTSTYKNTNYIVAEQAGAWHPIGDLQEIIYNLETTDIAENIDKSPQAEKVISGISSLWARTFIFKYALEVNPNANDNEGVKPLYNLLIEELKGFISFLALEIVNKSLSSTKIEIIKIPLDNGIFETIGEMLFDDRYLWRVEERLVDDANKEMPPVLQVIKLKNGSILGAASPYTLFFTPTEKKVEGVPAKFYNTKLNRWINPIVNLSNNELTAINSYVHMLRDSIEDFRMAIEKEGGQYNQGGMITFLESFMVELQGKGAGLQLIGTAPIFGGEENALHRGEGNTASNNPWSKFDKKLELFVDYENGRFYKTLADGRQSVKVEELLAPSEQIIKIKESLEDVDEFCYLLKIKTKSKNKEGKEMDLFEYYAVPLSDKGIILFKNLSTEAFSKLLTHQYSNEEQGFRHRLFGTKENGKIKISLNIEYYESDINDMISNYEVSKEYAHIETIGTGTEDPVAVMTWPNFVSQNWNQYFLYSNIPHNHTGNFTAKPIILDLENDDNYFKVKCEDGNETKLEYLPTNENTDIQNNGLIVLHKPSIKPQYEVYISEKPFLGVELRYGINKVIAGYVIQKVFTLQTQGFTPITIAVDFGSNNSAIGYSPTHNTDINPLVFKNRRQFLLGKEVSKEKRDKEDAMNQDLFFFQRGEENNEEPASGQEKREERKGQFKSMFLVHKINKSAISELANKEKHGVTSGSFVFEKNLPIVGKSLNAYILTNDNSLKFNLKWERKAPSNQAKGFVSLLDGDGGDDRSNTFLEGFFRKIILLAKVELFSEGIIDQLKWAYPSVMSEDLKHAIDGSWQAALPGVTVTEYTESQAVAFYSIYGSGTTGGQLGVSTYITGIGLDIGGSTSDIFVLSDENEGTCLIRQNSILMAADVLPKLIESSKNVQELIKSFLKENEKTFFIKGGSSLTSDNGGFYLNAIFDRLSSSQMQMFYSTLYNKNKYPFVATSFVAGFLVYYAGILVKESKPHVEGMRYNIGIYGKGGNIFNWLYAAHKDKAVINSFYQKAFLLGLMGKIEGNEKDYFEDFNFLTSTENNKMEVTYGMLAAGYLGEKDDTSITIGETGYKFDGEDLPSNHKLSDEEWRQFNRRLKVPADNFVVLELYIDHFAQFWKERAFANHEVLSKGKAEVRKHFATYLTNTHPEFRKAYNNTEGDTFNFKSSLLALQATCYLDKVILGR